MPGLANNIKHQKQKGMQSYNIYIYVYDIYMYMLYVTFRYFTKILRVENESKGVTIYYHII